MQCKKLIFSHSESAEYGSHVGVKMDLAGVAVQYGEKSYF